MQLYKPVELIVIDNQSSDSTRKIASGYADVVETFGPERSAQRNRGARVAHGDYFLFIDSDMQLAPSVIGDCIDAAGAARAPAVVVPEKTIGDGFLARCRALERSCYSGDDLVEAARFFDRRAFEEAGGFDEHLTGPEDWDLSRRVALNRRLPRTMSYISHDEARLSLYAILAKKRYYAGSSLRYWRKHRGSTIQQANLVFRPAFVRNWRRLLRHPILTVGFLTVKGLEAGAVGWGVIAELVRHPTRQPGGSTQD